ncbi:SET domain-containing protein [Fistulina hepatica ATCC 64428]|uniref:SET domain-containing protein n=1 Tax=Fistulina hepatica ATCC 64428 TaxID=1128425 RepID=A0A0D7A1U5_9AGAR|nr:SET domain-containing protein [Fistulina hepatica ATCC 64428]
MVTLNPQALYPHDPRFVLRTTSYGGRGLFTNENVSQNTLILRCDSPYASAIFLDFRKEVCTQCFAYTFEFNRNSWSIKHKSAGVFRFCSETCKNSWVKCHDLDLMDRVHSAIARALKQTTKSSKSVQHWPSLPALVTRESIDAAWDMAASKISVDQAPVDMEMEIVYYVLSALIRHHAESVCSSVPLPADRAIPSLTGTCHETWESMLQLQDNELSHLRVRPDIFAVHTHVFVFLRSALQDIPELNVYFRTPNLVRVLLARDHGNSFGLFDTATQGYNEMFGWAMYPMGSYFNHDCNPNVRKARNGRAMEFYTTRDVPAGSELCISYIDTTEKVHERREQLALYWDFVCNCKRCVKDISSP